MDVRAKRFLWNFIIRLTRDENKSVIITSHSMEECEMLCDRKENEKLNESIFEFFFRSRDYGER